MRGKWAKLPFSCTENSENLVGKRSGPSAKEVGIIQTLTIKTIYLKTLVKGFGSGAGYLN